MLITLTSQDVNITLTDGGQDGWRIDFGSRLTVEVTASQLAQLRQAFDAFPGSGQPEVPNVRDAIQQKLRQLEAQHAANTKAQEVLWEVWHRTDPVSR